MTVGPLLTEVVLTFCLAAGILYKYGNWRKQNVLVTIAVLISWYFSFLIIFVLPLDVSSTVFRQCIQENIHGIDNGSEPIFNKSLVTCEEPWSNVPENVLPHLWRVVYWTSQILTWLVMPLMQSYARAGEFTIRGKLKSALVDNAIYYGSYLFICGVLLIYIAVKPGLQLDGQKLKAIASSASNTWGLLLLVGLLGYSLVEIPRSLWASSLPGHNLQLAYFKLAKIAADRAEAEESLDDILDSIQSVVSCMRADDPLYPELETVLHKMPLQLRQRSKQPRQHDSIIAPTLKSLVRIHKQLIKGLHTARRCETQWELAVSRAILLEDVQNNRVNPERRFKHSFNSTPYLVSPVFEWYWRCMLEWYVLRSAAVIAGLLSAAVVWSEVTFFNKSPVLSLFAIFLNLAKASYDYFTIEVVSTVIIAYLCLCAYSTVLRIRLLNYYYLAPHHQTDEHSLIFSGMMLCRLTPPMCLNFLGLIHMDSHIIKSRIMETYYTQVMGHMDVVSIISDGFNIYLPMVVVALCLATYLSIGSRLLSLLGFPQFLDDDDLTSELVDEGRDLVAREKRRRERTEESAGRRRDFLDRLSSSARPFWSDKVTGLSREDSRGDLLSRSEAMATQEPPVATVTSPPHRIFDDV